MSAAYPLSHVIPADDSDEWGEVSEFNEQSNAALAALCASVLVVMLRKIADSTNERTTAKEARAALAFITKETFRP